jgi:predicted membrane protein
MIIVQIIGFFTIGFLILCFIGKIIEYFENKTKHKQELLDFKNQIETEDLRQSWIKFLEKEYKSDFWKEKIDK